MLRLRPARVLPPLTASRQSQRLIWSRASNFMACLGLGDSESSESSTSPIKQPSVKCKVPDYRWAKRKRVLRAQPSADASFPTFQQSVNLEKRKNAVDVLSCFLQKIKHVSTSKQLLDAWKIISECRPFVVHKHESFHVRLASAENVHDNRFWLLQVVPANVFAELSAK
ncbi:unnamed protein product [Peronospora destructor]|uniref:Uncharacterized protein n=1 Tax=Peronospora destructor TaxID=86335 RepID=A0AAV0TQU5_9STRA|nr:unnamed protein product [Peronospora destructor]